MSSPETSVASVAKAAQLLHTLAVVPEAQSVRQLADRMGIPRSTVHALCATLCQEQLLERVPGEGYRLGPALVELGGHVISRTGLQFAAQGLLARLSPVRAGGISLSQYNNGSVVYLQRSPGAAGPSVPAHLTASGRAVLAALPWDKATLHVQRSCVLRARPLPDLGELALALARVRDVGYAVCGSYRPGRISVAAVIRNGPGHPVGAVASSGPGDRFAPAVIRRSGQDVLEVAGQISRRLGTPVAR